MVKGGISAECAARLRVLDWGSLTKRVAYEGLKEGQEPTPRTLEVTAEVISSFFAKHAAEWDHVADPTAFLTLCRLVKNRKKTVRDQETDRQKLVPIVVDAAAEEQAPISDRGLDEEMIREESAARKRERLRAGLEGSPIAQRLVDLFEEEGILKAAEAAKRLGVTVAEVYTANAQLRRHTERIGKEGSDPDIAVVSARSAAS